MSAQVLSIREKLSQRGQHRAAKFAKMFLSQMLPIYILHKVYATIPQSVLVGRGQR